MSRDFQSENEIIEAVVKSYYEGIVNANPEQITEAFAIDTGHLKAVATDDSGNEFVKVEPFADARTRWDTGNSIADASGNVESIDIVDGKLAIVKFDLRLGQVRFLDVLSLYKINGQWKVVNKVFVVRSV